MHRARMRLNPDGLICGARAAVVRRLLSRDRFGTVRAMAVFSTNEPEVTDRLIQLEAEGWIRFDGQRDGEDWWETTEQGNRLSATKILKRITTAEGWKIVERLLAETRSINSEPMRSFRVTAIYLFGSMVTGTEDGTVGDVDVVVSNEWRRLPKTDLAAIEKAEGIDKARGLSRFFWGSDRIKAQLRRTSRYVTLHDSADLRLPGNVFRQIYAFDVGQESEVAFDPTDQLHPDPLNDAPEAKTGSPATVAQKTRSWPEVRVGQQVSIDGRSGQRAQHLWQNGLSATEIAHQTHVEPEHVEAYLASCAFKELRTPIIQPSLSGTLSSILPVDANFGIFADVGIGRGVGVTRTSAFKSDPYEHLGRAFLTYAADIYVGDAQPEAVHALIVATKAASIWRGKMKGRAGRLALEVTASSRADGGSKLAKTAVDFRSLEAPMTAALEQLWERREPSDTTMTLLVQMDRADRSRVRLRRRTPDGAIETRAPSDATASINKVLREIRARWAANFDGRDHYTLSLVRYSDDDDAEDFEL